jgi:hypothetical protein
MYKISRNKLSWEIVSKGKLHQIPSNRQIVIYGATLRNERKEKSTVHIVDKKKCGIIECEDYVVLDEPTISSFAQELYYSEEKRPFWFDDNKINLDNVTFDCLTTYGSHIYIN